MQTVGPYTFTETDAARTLANAEIWWRHLTDGLDASGLGAQRALLTDALAGGSLAGAWAALFDASTALRAAGQIPTAGRGEVVQLSRSGGGVPKLAVERVSVAWRGVEGDGHRYRVHHGRPWQALCLWSAEVIDQFAADGHPIRYGAAGENVTIAGLDWSVVRAGVRLRIGTVLAEASLWALPCTTNARWFIGGAFDTMHHERGPVSRMYATVIEPGEIATGDAVTLEA